MDSPEKSPQREKVYDPEVLKEVAEFLDEDEYKLLTSQIPSKSKKVLEDKWIDQETHRTRIENLLNLKFSADIGRFDWKSLAEGLLSSKDFQNEIYVFLQQPDYIFNPWYEANYAIFLENRALWIYALKTSLENDYKERFENLYSLNIPSDKEKMDLLFYGARYGKNIAAFRYLLKHMKNLTKKDKEDLLITAMKNKRNLVLDELIRHFDSFTDKELLKIYIIGDKNDQIRKFYRTKPRIFKDFWQTFLKEGHAMDIGKHMVIFLSEHPVLLEQWIHSAKSLAVYRIMRTDDVETSNLIENLLPILEDDKSLYRIEDLALILKRKDLNYKKLTNVSLFILLGPDVLQDLIERGIDLGLNGNDIVSIIEEWSPAELRKFVRNMQGYLIRLLKGKLSSKRRQQLEKIIVSVQ